MRIGIVLLSVSGLWAAPMYNVVPVPYNQPGMTVTSFSDNGWVAGWDGGGAFSSDGTTMTRYPAMGIFYGQTVGVSASGQIVTSYFTTSYAPTAWLGTAGVWQELLGGPGPRTVYGISDGGMAVGRDGLTGATWTNGVYQSVPDSVDVFLVSRSGSAMLGMVNSTSLTLFHRVGGSTTEIPWISNQLSLAGGLNDFGQYALSNFDSSGVSRLIIGDAAGYQVVPGIPDNRSVSMARQSMNNAGQVVFSTYPAGGGFGDGFIWDAANGVRSLSDLAGIGIARPVAINNRGQIIAETYGYGTVLLDPISAVPEPGTFVLGGLALGALVVRSRQR